MRRAYYACLARASGNLHSGRFSRVIILPRCHSREIRSRARQRANVASAISRTSPRRRRLVATQRRPVSRNVVARVIYRPPPLTYRINPDRIIRSPLLTNSLFALVDIAPAMKYFQFAIVGAVTAVMRVRQTLMANVSGHECRKISICNYAACLRERSPINLCTAAI